MTENIGYISNSAQTSQPDIEKSIGEDIPSETTNGPTQSGSSLSSQEKQQLSSNNDGVEPTRRVTGYRWILICIAIYSANILYGLDTTIAADIQADVSEAYDNVTQLGWLGVGFTLGSTVAILPLGKVYGIFNNKWIFINCLAHFAAASALCGAAPTMSAVIVGRVWAGAGGAGMYLGTLNLVTVTSTPKEQPFYVGLTGFAYGSGCILGPVVGGLFADSAATWRWAFYLNLVIFGAMSPIYLFLLPSLPRHPGTTFTQKLKGLDWLGTVLTGGLYVSFTLAFTFGGAIWDWDDARVIALIVLFIIFTIVFAVTQYYSVFTNKMDRLFPCEFLRDPQLILLYVCMACGGAALFVSIYYIPLYFLFVHGDSGTEAAVRLLPFICFYVATILACGAFMGRVGYHWLWYLISGLFMTAGGTTMYTVNADTAAANIYGYTTLVGLGMATTQAGYAVGPLLVRPERVAELIQFLNISQGSSQLIGLAIAGSMFQSITFAGLQDVLRGTGYPDSEIRAAIAGARSDILQNANPELRARCIDVIVRSIRNAWVLVITAGALWTVCSCFLTKRRFVT
ncbi:MFS general substrate transporter [Patellaria atrata CBS 101060]|uniref:MFS general substrate transporter n=1 Tax=Patellaria atrata CBS 101060 TaxID=1346257 RepID=A0A9P4S4S4_9PEZI|nr:MFS general substrate transporter [Patellaria atrata CBS 101060]